MFCKKQFSNHLATASHQGEQEESHLLLGPYSLMFGEKVLKNRDP
jgi:hypothetical protein